jgi:hypothetical protein
VFFKYSVSQDMTDSDDTVTWDYEGSSAAPQVGVLARTGVGTYQTQVDSTGLPGYWTVEYISKGICQTVGMKQVYVAPALL